MSKPTTVIVLCEDDTTSILLRSHLKRHGVFHGIRVNVTLWGSGFDWVLRNYPDEVNAYRISKAKKETWLIVAIDADEGTVVSRVSQLDARLKQSENLRVREMRVQGEKIARLVPRRNVETWILVLTGTSATEEEDHKYRKSKEEWQDLAQPAGVTLFDWTRTNFGLPSHCIPSIRHAVGELRRLESPK
jgi:hypothetical protein